MDCVDWAYKNTNKLLRKDFKTSANCIVTTGASEKFVNASFDHDGLAFLIGMAIARYEREKSNERP